jgi:hypothetical protein
MATQQRKERIVPAFNHAYEVQYSKGALYLNSDAENEYRTQFSSQ